MRINKTVMPSCDSPLPVEASREICRSRNAPLSREERKSKTRPDKRGMHGERCGALAIKAF